MAQSFPPPSDTSSKVELSVSCSSLKNLDYFSKSDPTVFLYTRGREAGWVKVGRTEVIDNNLNPKVYFYISECVCSLYAVLQQGFALYIRTFNCRQIES